MRRRTFTRLAGAGLVGAHPRRHRRRRWAAPGAEAFATALVTPDGCSRQPDSQPISHALTTAVANAKRAYQACRYTEVMSQMPRLLPVLQATCDHLDSDAKSRAYALSAEAHHVAASVLFKLGDQGLAWLAADRSMQTASQQDPVAVAPAPGSSPTP